MKRLLILLFCIYFIPVNAQNKVDYDNVVGKFMQFYNNNQPDSICNLFSDTWGNARKTLWTAEKLKETKDKFGRMISYSYLSGKPGDLLLYKVVFEKSTHAMGLSLDKKSKLLTFRFMTTSDSIEKLLCQSDSNSNPKRNVIERYKTDSLKVISDKQKIQTDSRNIEHDKSRTQHDSADLKRHLSDMKNDMIRMHNDSIRMNESIR